MNKITCLSKNCPERKSLCCNAKCEPTDSIHKYANPFMCKKCGKDFKGGECYARQRIENFEVLYRRNLRFFKKFLTDECYDEKEYGEGKYDVKIYNWFHNK